MKSFARHALMERTIPPKSLFLPFTPPVRALTSIERLPAKPTRNQCRYLHGLFLGYEVPRARHHFQLRF